jgi:uncharacterized membrane protein SirB2
MAPVYLHNPTHILWQTDLFDLLMLGIFVMAAIYSAMQFRRGRRIYASLMVTAFIYGLVLELGGMATHHSYTQGTFTVMLNFPALALFRNSTQMPSYVPIFYPVVLFIGFKVLEALGIRSRWQAAITGGLIMVFIDAPYIIEGGLRDIVWWTWHPDFPMYQLWLGWPLVDLWWHATWDALFFYLMLRFLPRIDAGVGSPHRWSNARTLGVFPPIAAAIVLLCGSVLCAPVAAVTYLGGRQWPVVLTLVVIYAVIAGRALRNAVPSRVEPITVAVVGVYAACFTAMVCANVMFEGRMTLYIAVQTAGLVLLCVTTALPFLLARRTRAAETELHQQHHATV